MWGIQKVLQLILCTCHVTINIQKKNQGQLIAYAGYNGSILHGINILRGLKIDKSQFSDVCQLFLQVYFTSIADELINLTHPLQIDSSILVDKHMASLKTALQ